MPEHVRYPGQGGRVVDGTDGEPPTGDVDRVADPVAGQLRAHDDLVGCRGRPTRLDLRPHEAARRHPEHVHIGRVSVGDDVLAGEDDGDGARDAGKGGDRGHAVMQARARIRGTDRRRRSPTIQASAPKPVHRVGRLGIEPAADARHGQGQTEQHAGPDHGHREPHPSPFQVSGDDGTHAIAVVPWVRWPTSAAVTAGSATVDTSPASGPTRHPEILPATVEDRRGGRGTVQEWHPMVQGTGRPLRLGARDHERMGWNIPEGSWRRNTEHDRPATRGPRTAERSPGAAQPDARRGATDPRALT